MPPGKLVTLPRPPAGARARPLTLRFQAPAKSAADAMSANLASVTKSAGDMIAAASQSAASAANQAASMVKQAQADATAVRVSDPFLHRSVFATKNVGANPLPIQTEANTQVQQAQGAAVSVTQAALAIVGAIIGSSLLTIVAFTLILRCRRIKRRKSRLAASSHNNISYPALEKSSNVGPEPGFFEQPYDSSMSRTDNPNGFPFDLKQPPRAAPSGPLRAPAAQLSHQRREQLQQRQQRRQGGRGRLGNERLWPTGRAAEH